jgi:DNA ligase-1
MSGDLFKPMLAESITDLSKLRYPLIASPKLDGIRAINRDGRLVSRRLKPIPNSYAQAVFSGASTLSFDGELICGDPTAKDVYNRTSRAVMSRDGEPDVTWYLFDDGENSTDPFVSRLDHLRQRAAGLPRCKVLEQHYVTDEGALLALEEKYLEQGYEGLMLRSPGGRYKYGRSTEKEGLLLKLKRFRDDEFKVVGFEERLHNANEAKTNALGHTERSSHQENKVGRGDLGALILETRDGAQFHCGSGFTDEDRREIWNERDQALGRWAKIKHFAYGVVDKPRFPVFLGWRFPLDMEGSAL